MIRTILDTLSVKLRTLQEIDEQILDSLYDEQNIEKEIDESSEFALFISKHQNHMQLWIKSQTETPEKIRLFQMLFHSLHLQIQ